MDSTINYTSTNTYKTAYINVYIFIYIYKVNCIYTTII